MLESKANVINSEIFHLIFLSQIIFRRRNKKTIRNKQLKRKKKVGERESTSEGNSAHRRSHMKMALRYMKSRRLCCTDSMSMVSMAASIYKHRHGEREREEALIFGGFLGSNQGGTCCTHFQKTRHVTRMA